MDEGSVIVDVGGVGYRVHVPAALLADLGPVGATVTLHTYLHVRETELELFGAADPEALALFRMLLSVSGVGPRSALAMLSAIDPTALQQAIVGEDIARLTEVPGIGRRTAQRIILDLRGKLEAAGVVAAPAGRFDAGAADPAAAEALAALVALGYTRGEARRALAMTGAQPDMAIEARIVAALRVLGG